MRHAARAVRAALVFAVIVGVAVATWWLTRDDEVVVPPAPFEHVDAPPPVAVVAPAPPAAAPGEVTDAGSPAAAPKPIDVRFEVHDGRSHAVGFRLDVACEGTRVSGLVNVMGGLTLPLSEGPWRVLSHDVEPETFDVTPGMGTVALRLRQPREVRGRVVTSEGAPVPGIDVVMSERKGREHRQTTDGAGRFAFSALVRVVELHAVSDTYVSQDVQRELPNGEIELVVEPAYTLRLELKDVTLAGVTVSHRFGNESKTCRVECDLTLPSGPYRLVAATAKLNEVWMARVEGHQPPGPDVRELTFARAPRITGVVTDAEGAPLADVPVRLLPALTTRNVAAATTVSGLDGAFSFEPDKAGSAFGRGWTMPSWRVEPMAPWVGPPSYVSFGDAPISLTAELNVAPR